MRRLTVGLLALASQAQAVTSEWRVASGKWENPANWSSGTAPTGTDTAYIANEGTCVIDKDTPYTGGTQAFKGDLYIGHGGVDGALDISSTGGYVGFNAMNCGYVGHGATGVVSLAGHNRAWFRGGSVYIGVEADGVGILNMSDGYVFFPGTRVGYKGGRGIVNLAGGSIGTGVYGLLTADNGGQAVFNLEGGTITPWFIWFEGAAGTPCEVNYIDTAAVINVLGTKSGYHDTRPRNGIAFGLSETSRVKVTAVPGSEIQFTASADADVEFRTAGPAAAADLAGLNNITLVYRKNNCIVGDNREPDECKYSQLEIGGADLGARMAGFEENFALDGLTLLTPGAPTATYSGTNTVQLVDNYANAGTQGEEVLYVKHLAMQEATVLDLNGRKLYYLDGDFEAGTILNGSPIQVPLHSPRTVLLLR